MSLHDVSGGCGEAADLSLIEDCDRKLLEEVQMIYRASMQEISSVAPPAAAEVVLEAWEVACIRTLNSLAGDLETEGLMTQTWVLASTVAFPSEEMLGLKCLQ